ncbi:MAG: methyltransferase domain-containing protein [Lachnospiraceae bacterium]
MKLNRLKQEWKREENYVFKGWDFSHLNGRWETESLPWDYTSIVKEYVKPFYTILDMGTGGGEFLLSLQHPYHLTYATEGYLPNFELCKNTLEPLGISVEYVAADNVLNFDRNTFDIVLNRHEDFDVKEVNRVLKSGGYFITQQVGGENGNDLSRKLLDDFQPLFPKHRINIYLEQLVNLGYEVLIADEIFPKMKFFDVGALVYYAKIIEWEFPKFDVERCFDHLVNCQKELESKGFISGTEHRFIIVCKKP